MLLVWGVWRGLCPLPLVLLLAAPLLDCAAACCALLAAPLLDYATIILYNVLWKYMTGQQGGPLALWHNKREFDRIDMRG